MAMVAVDDFMSEVLEDEGWMEGLDQAVVERAIARLEALLPAGSTLAAAEAARLRAALRELNARAAGAPDVLALVDGLITGAART